VEKFTKPCVAFSGNSTNLVHHLSLHHTREHGLVIGHATAQTQQLITLILARSRNNIVKISQRIDLWITLRLTPYLEHSILGKRYPKLGA